MHFFSPKLPASGYRRKENSGLYPEASPRQQKNSNNSRKNFEKPLEIQKKVVYNGFKWWKVVNSGRKWGESGRPISKRGEFIVNRRI